MQLALIDVHENGAVMVGGVLAQLGSGARNLRKTKLIIDK